MLRDVRSGHAWLLTIYLLLALAVPACTMFQKDPVGSSLIAARNGYESVVRESGSAYKAGAISADQLKQIVALGRKFHDSYGLAVDAHLLQNEKDEQMYQLQLQKILAEMQDLARKYYGYGSTYPLVPPGGVK